MYPESTSVEWLFPNKKVDCKFNKTNKVAKPRFISCGSAKPVLDSRKIHIARHLVTPQKSEKCRKGYRLRARN